MAASSHADHFFQTTSTLEETERKARKAANALGEPTKFSTKLLALVIDHHLQAHDDVVYVAQSGGDVNGLTLSSPEQRTVLRGPKAPVTCLAIHAATDQSTGARVKTVYAGSWDKSIWSFPVSDQTHADKTAALRPRSFPAHSDFVKSLAIAVTADKESIIISGGAGGDIGFWSLSGDRLAVVKANSRAVECITVDPFAPSEAPAVFFGTSQRNIFSTVLPAKTQLSSKSVVLSPLPAAHATSVYKLHFDDDGDLWTASADKTCKRLVRDSGWKEDTVLQHPDFVKDVVTQDRYGLVLTACRDEEIRVWDKASSQLRHVFTGHFEEVTGLALSGDDLVSVSIDATLRRWSVEPKALQKAIEAAKGADAAEAKADSGPQLTAEEEAELRALMEGEEADILDSMAADKQDAEVPLQSSEGQCAAVRTMDLTLRNVLANSQSPYLRAHKDNPVAWQEWTVESLALAKTHQRLIFLSIGYNACHWCHVMERESFCSTEVAELLNSSFIPIKLDRELRPDLDDIYMNFVTATTGSGGWPLNVFLTPDLEPVFGGTYWPGPSASTTLHRVSTNPDESPTTFLDILRKMESVWTHQRDRCLRSAAEVTKQLRWFAEEGTHSHTDPVVRDASSEDSPEPLDLDLLDDALSHFVSQFDPVNGGFSPSAGSPKFTTPVILTFLLRIGASVAYPSTHTRFGFPNPVPGILGKDSCAQAASMALKTLRVLSRSGLRDHLGHGFHRYSVTADWNLPHFEKMLYDNAQLLSCYSDAWALRRDPEILGTIFSLVEYFTSPSSSILSPDGVWYASEDADSIPNFGSASSTTSPIDGQGTEKKEGAYYVWSHKRFTDILPEPDAAILAAHFGVLPDGNIPAALDIHDEFLNQNVLHIAATPSTLAKQFQLPLSEIVAKIKSGKATLSNYRRTQRVPPDVDNKVILSCNALAITALARAANTLATIDSSRSQRCIAAATRALNFIKTRMYDSSTGKLSRIYEPDSHPAWDRSASQAFLDDYAYLTTALLSVYDLTFDRSLITWAENLHPGGYFQAQHADDQLFRLKPGTDNSLPSANGVIANNLFYLGAHVPDQEAQYTRQARAILDAFGVEIIQHPFLYVSMLSAVVLDQVGVRRLIVPRTLDDVAVSRYKGFGRTVEKGDVDKN
ncbi:hypothetical protein DV738_g4496, partial [Chaetothyriales sp. CBS 135597]